MNDLCLSYSPSNDASTNANDLERSLFASSLLSLLKELRSKMAVLETVEDGMEGEINSFVSDSVVVSALSVAIRTFYHALTFLRFSSMVTSTTTTTATSSAVVAPAAFSLLVGTPTWQLTPDNLSRFLQTKQGLALMRGGYLQLLEFCRMLGDKA